eukprot:scpid91048/ scgid7775/ 
MEYEVDDYETYFISYSEASAFVGCFFARMFSQPWQDGSNEENFWVYWQPAKVCWSAPLYTPTCSLSINSFACMVEKVDQSGLYVGRVVANEAPDISRWEVMSIDHVIGNSNEPTEIRPKIRLYSGSRSSTFTFNIQLQMILKGLHTLHVHVCGVEILEDM